MRSRIEAAIIQAIDEVNLLRADTPLDVTLDENFLAENSKLDSFGALTFIMGLEPKLKSDLNISVDLLAAVSNGQNKDSFATFRDLAVYIEEFH